MAQGEGEGEGKEGGLRLLLPPEVDASPTRPPAAWLEDVDADAADVADAADGSSRSTGS